MFAKFLKLLILTFLVLCSYSNVNAQTDYTGYVDGIFAGGVVKGWAKDTIDVSRTVVIKFYKDKSAFDGGDYLGKVSANIASTDVGAHRFEWNIPNQYLKNSTKIYVYSTDKNETPIFLLNNSPAIIQTTDSIPHGYLDGITQNGKVFGWAKDDDFAGAIKIHFYKNGPAGVGTYIGETTANIASTDVGAHRFEWQIPVQYLDTSFRVYVHAINYPQNNSLNIKIGNSPQLYIPDISKQILSDTLYIAPIWHRLDRPYDSTDNFWQNMKTRLGGDMPYIKVGMTAYVQYTAHTNGPSNNYDYNGSVNYTEAAAAPEHQNDSLDRYYNMAKDYGYDVVLNLSGSPWNEWFDCSCADANIYGCSSRDNNVLTFLEETDINVQWDQNNVRYNDSCTVLPPLQRIVTFNIYNKDVMYFMEKNIKQATDYIWKDSSKKNITKAFSTDADAFFAVWGGGGLDPNNSLFDYNPDSIQQFRDWLFCKGEYSPSGNFPFLKPQNCFNDLNSLNISLNTNFQNYVAVSPPRQVSEGFKDNNNLLWQKWLFFRQHMVFVNNYLKLLWVSEAGVPANMIYGHPGFPTETPNIGNVSSSPLANNMGVSLESGGVYPFGNGTNLYGDDAKNTDNQFFQRIKNTNPNWGIFETSAVSLTSSQPETFNDYYKSLQQARLHGARFLSPIAWHVGYFDGAIQTNGPVKVRDTAYEDAIREFVNTYGNYPITDTVWEFGMKTSNCFDKTGMTDCSEYGNLDRTQLEGWTFSGYNNSELENGVVSLNVTNTDPQFISPDNLSLNGERTNLLALVVKVSGNGEQIPAEVFFQTEQEKFWDQQKSFQYVVSADNKWHTYIIEVGLNNKWINKVSRLRLDLGNTGINKNVDLDLVWINRKDGLVFDLNYNKVVDKQDLTKSVSEIFSDLPVVNKLSNIELDSFVKSISYVE